MLRPDFFQYSCYKFMFLLGVIDMIVLPFNSVYSGIQCMLGYHYCNNPSLHFIIGAIPTCKFFNWSYSDLWACVYFWLLHACIFGQKSNCWPPRWFFRKVLSFKVVPYKIWCWNDPHDAPKRWEKGWKMKKYFAIRLSLTSASKRVPYYGVWDFAHSRMTNALGSSL